MNIFKIDKKMPFSDFIYSCPASSNDVTYAIGVFARINDITENEFFIDLCEYSNDELDANGLFSYIETNFISMTITLNNFFNELYNNKLVNDHDFINMCVFISESEGYELDEEFINTDMYIRWKLKEGK